MLWWGTSLQNHWNYTLRPQADFIAIAFARAVNNRHIRLKKTKVVVRLWVCLWLIQIMPLS